MLSTWKPARSPLQMQSREDGRNNPGRERQVATGPDHRRAVGEHELQETAQGFGAVVGKRIRGNEHVTESGNRVDAFSRAVGERHPHLTLEAGWTRSGSGFRRSFDKCA